MSQPSPKVTLMRAFNKCFYDFMDDIMTVFEDKTPFAQAKKNCEMIQSANPAILVRAWHQYVYSKYAEVIDTGNTDFFLEKDYSDDINQFDYAEHIMKVINTFRQPLKNLSGSNKEMAMKHIQMLSRVSAKYAEVA
jgi:hypothetical protein